MLDTIADGHLPLVSEYRLTSHMVVYSFNQMRSNMWHRRFMCHGDLWFHIYDQLWRIAREDTQDSLIMLSMTCGKLLYMGWCVTNVQDRYCSQLCLHRTTWNMI